MAWSEDKHPRDEDGKFTDKGGSPIGEAQRLFARAKELGVPIDKDYINYNALKTKVAEKEKELQSANNDDTIKNTRKRFINIQLFAPGRLENQTVKELKRTAKSLQENIDLHKDKIKNPAKYCQDWDSIDKQKKKGRIKFWEKEIKNHSEQLVKAKKLIGEKNGKK